MKAQCSIIPQTLLDQIDVEEAYPVAAQWRVGGDCSWEKKHAPACSSEEHVLPTKMGATEERFRW